MNKKYIVRQNDICDCGPCCLSSIIKYYNGNIPLEIIRLDTKTTINGTTAYNIINAAKKYGFSSIGIKVNDIKSKELSYPLIAHLSLKNGLNHFVVVYSIKKETINIMDPAKGYVNMNLKDFNEVWTNTVILFNPESNLPIIEKQSTMLNIIYNIISNNKKITISIIINSFLISILSLLITYYIQIFINFSNSYSNVIFIIITFLILYILKIYYNYVRNNYMITLNRNIDLNILNKFINHLFNLPLSIISTRTSGELITRVYEINNIKNLFSEIFITCILDTLFVLCSIFFLNNINSKLFLILCIVAITYIIIGIIFIPIINKKTNNNIDLETEFNGTLSEQIERIISIKNLNIKDYSIEKLNEKYTEYLSDSVGFSKLLNTYDTIKNLISELGIYIVSSIGLIYVTNNNLTLVELITFNSLITYFMEPIKNIINLLPRISLIKTSINKIEEFINIKPDEEQKDIEFLNGDITFNNVTYSYNDYSNIINNINFKILKNSRVSILGDSGSGKSTICNILNGNIKDYKGNIYIKDINIKNYNNKILKDNILYISQNEKLFSDTIYNNICIDKKYNIEELNSVLNLTYVDEILEKKKIGLNTFLLDGGFNLSGGERQRIILCRAVLRHPKILILDESLSEVNEDMERNILKGLDLYLKETTIIYISHGRNTFNSVLNL